MAEDQDKRNEAVEEEAAKERSNAARAGLGGGRRGSGGGGKSSSGGGGSNALGLAALVIALGAVGAAGFAFIRAGQAVEQTIEENEKLSAEVKELSDAVAIVNRISEESLGALRDNMQGALEEAREKLAQIDSEGIVANTNAINKMATAVQTARAEAAQVRNALPSLEGRIKSVVGNANKGIKNVQTQLGKRIDQVNSSVRKVSGGVDKRIVQIGKQVAEIKVANAKMQTAVVETGKRVAGLRKEIDRFGKLVTSFDTGALERLNARLRGIEQQVGQIPVRINALEQNMTQIQGRLARVGG
ncbi:MAG: hypothetical protein ISN29_08365 [Gammaproteobacteria bacterium AqS3]|nr:hypothetical protein [Gammaproteobacteria bacterium AqS3]